MSHLEVAPPQYCIIAKKLDAQCKLGSFELLGHLSVEMLLGAAKNSRKNLEEKHVNYATTRLVFYSNDSDWLSDGLK